MKNLACGLLLLALLLLLLVPQGIAQGLDGLKLQGEEFTYKLSQNKEPIQGILTKPSGNGPFPAVVVNHYKGGNAKQIVEVVGPIFIKAGYVVIACNLTHAGKDDGEEGDKNTVAGSQENADRIMACVKILENLPYVDAKKLCIYGQSMGAFATVGTCTQTDKFKAAAITAGGVRTKPGSICGEADVPKITTPFIILHGTDDQTVPVETGKRFKAVMDANNKVSELHIFDGVGHKLWKGEQQDEVFALILKFFAKHLK